jgi:hypothetical protein
MGGLRDGVAEEFGREAAEVGRMDRALNKHQLKAFKLGQVPQAQRMCVGEQSCGPGIDACARADN